MTLARNAAHADAVYLNGLIWPGAGGSGDPAPTALATAGGQVLAVGGDAQRRAHAALAGMAVRFLVMVALLGAGLLSGIEPRAVLGIWAALGYLALLAVDTAGLVWLNRRMARTS